MPLVPLKQTGNPLFNLARGAATVTAPPPFDFSGVVMRFFPLKADFLALSRFCDRYLNLAPEFAYFRPSMPFVMLCIVNYGRMSMEAGNLGWASQNEVLFSVPLEWYTRENGEYVFKDQAQVAPFIFVDDEASQVGGREVYGWPKVQGWFASGINPWAVDPRSDRRLLSLETRVFERLYAGQRPKPCELLAVDEEPPVSFSVVPPEAGNPLNPLVSIPRALLGWSELLAEGFDMWTTLPMRGYASIDRRTLPNLIASALGSMDVFTRNLQANTINLKQFRDAAEPSLACYQALTNAKMEISQFRRGGMLGDQALLRGDPSGGFRILLSRYESMPIVETLGLEVSSETQGEDSRIANLTPVLPFWQEVDLRYKLGEVLCWRTKELDWHDATRVSTQAEVEPKAPHAYNTTSSSGVQVATGPFRFPGVTLRVVPLRADPEKLEDICNKCLNEGLKEDPARKDEWEFADPVRQRVGKIRAVGSYVYLIVTSYGEMSSDSNNIGPWADKRVDFAIPVRWEGAKGRLERREELILIYLDGLDEDAEERSELKAELVEIRRLLKNLGPAEEQPVRTRAKRKRHEAFLEDFMDGFFSPFMYAEGGIETSTGREVNGWDIIEADIESPQSPWLGDIFAPAMPLLHLSMEVFPALGVGQKSQRRTVLEVLEEEQKKGTGETTGEGADAAADGGTEAPGELERVFLAIMKLLVGGYTGSDRAALTQFSLKQFRDAAEPLRACYQAIVRCPTVVERIHDEVRLIEQRLQVRIHDYPSQNIVDTLGLVVEKHEGNVACLEPAYGFYVQADLRAELAENLCWRAGSEHWRLPASPDE